VGFHYSINVTDPSFALSVIEHGEITSDTLERAGRMEMRF
jgi:hypothetical protein